MIDVAVCLAAYNRRDKTLACLARLFAADLPSGARLTAFLLDDASTDGTAAAVAATYPQVQLLSGNGNLFWAGGMRSAFGEALKGEFSHFIWLNDDVEIMNDSLLKLMASLEAVQRSHPGEHLIVGAMMDPVSRTTSYGGLVKGSPLRPWKLRRQPPDAERPVACDTINGNLVLIPRTLALRLGNIDPGFTHAFGDLDYGFRARKAGAGVWVAPGYAGYCTPNTSRPRWKRAGLSLRERFHMISSPLGVPIKDQFLYATRHFPIISPVVALAPYLTLLISHVRPERP